MTVEQLNLFEEYIKQIIRCEQQQADCADMVRLFDMRADILRIFAKVN